MSSSFNIFSTLYFLCTVKFPSSIIFFQPEDTTVSLVLAYWQWIILACLYENVFIYTF